MLSRVTAVEYVRPSDDSIIEVVVKFSSFCDQQQENLAMEALAACLAGDLRLPIPEPLLVAIPDEWIAIVPDEQRKKRILASSRVAFGSKLVTGGYSIWTPDTPISEAMVDPAASIFAFDAIIQNPDRRTSNPNCLIRGESIRIFDHELAFGHKLVLKWQPPWTKDGLNWLETKGAHIFRSRLRRSMIDFDAIKAAWIAITDNRLTGYKSGLPAEWMPAVVSRVQSAITLVQEARENFDACVEEIRRVLS
jgi:hypothetical protein